jgi:threonine dehydrogenase-like Zn-dependent dehydrogenase
LLVLAAARLRALQLDSSRAAADRAAARKIQENSQPDDSTLVTGPGLYALLTVVALMGADVSTVIVSVDAHCPTSSTASALSAVSVTLLGEVTNRLSNPLGSVHHGKMARLIAGNRQNRQVAMASDAGLRGE